MITSDCSRSPYEKGYPPPERQPRFFNRNASDERSHISDLSLSRLGQPWVRGSDSNVQTIWIADMHHGDGKRFVVRSDEKVTAFLELESVICPCGKLV